MIHFCEMIFFRSNNLKSESQFSESFNHVKQLLFHISLTSRDKKQIFFLNFSLREKFSAKKITFENFSIFGENFPNKVFLFRSEIGQKWQRHHKSPRTPRRKPPPEVERSPKRSGLKENPGTSSKICACSISQHMTKSSRKFQTTRYVFFFYFQSSPDRGNSLAESWLNVGYIWNFF